MQFVKLSELSSYPGPYPGMKHHVVANKESGFDNFEIIYSKLPDMDIISIGPDMYDIHSPDEALDLDSTEIFWKTLVRLIETV